MEVPTDILTFSLDVPVLLLPEQPTAKPVRRSWLVYNPRSSSIVIHGTQLEFLLEPQSYQIVEGI
jgi:hypothetical protein